MTVLQINGPRFEKCGVQSYYAPVMNGVHLCGQTLCETGSQPYTAMNISSVSSDEARLLFERLKTIASCNEDEADFIIDLQQDNDCTDDFSTNRQLMTSALLKMSH